MNLFLLVGCDAQKDGQRVSVPEGSAWDLALSEPQATTLSVEAGDETGTTNSRRTDVAEGSVLPGRERNSPATAEGDFSKAFPSLA